MSNVKDALEAAQGIVEAVPIYEDMLQPASKELGKGLLTISKTVNLALAPLTGFVWGYEKIAQYLQQRMTEKLKDVPEENITTPDPTLAVPAIEALRYTAHNEALREMFSNLIASAMDKSTAPLAHPSFVEIIKQISSEEAKIIKLLDGKTSIPVVKLRIYGQPDHHFAEPLINFSMLPFQAGCSYPDLGPSYLENITRLGLTNISYDTYSIHPNVYDPIETHAVINKWKSIAESQNKRLEINRGALMRTSFGQKFYDACVESK